MRNLKIIFTIITMMAFVCSCNNNDEPKPNPNGVNENPFKGIIFTAGITNPEGNNGSVYMQCLPDLQPGNYDNTNGIPVGFGTTPIVAKSGNIYVLPDYMGNTKAELICYRINADNKWSKKGAMPIPPKAAACCVTELNNEKAYISLQGLGTILVFNPTTMTRIGEIDLNSLKQADTNVSPASMVIRDGKLFVGLNQMNAQYMPTRNNIELAVIDTKTDKVEKHIVNTSLGMSFATRPIDPGSIFVDENNDIYINCIGSFGFIPGLHGGIARIKNGTTDIDPDYCIRLDNTEVRGLTTKFADFFATICYGGNGKVYAYANSFGLDPNGMSNPYISLTNVPIIIDLQQKTLSVINGMEISNPQGIAVGKYKNLIVFGSANKKANGFYTYNPATKEVAGPIIQVKGNPSFFYSFVE